MGQGKWQMLLRDRSPIVNVALVAEIFIKM